MGVLHIRVQMRERRQQGVTAEEVQKLVQRAEQQQEQSSPWTHWRVHSETRGYKHNSERESHEVGALEPGFP